MDYSKESQSGSLRKMLNELVETKEFKEMYISPRLDHVLATPLVEILSVHIESQDRKPSQVFGTIQAIDGEGRTFNLYNRKKGNEETILCGGSLMLTLPKGDTAISASSQVRVDIDIKDNTRNSDIVGGHLIWDYKIKHDYDDVQTEYVKGSCGHATVRYITYSRAVMDVIPLSGGCDDANSVDANVYGTIVARGSKNCSSVLLQTTKEQSEKVKYGSPIHMSRHVVAVPANSPFTIGVDLQNRNTGKQIRGEVTYREVTHSETDSFRVGDQQNGMVNVKVKWSHLYMHPSPKRKHQLMFEEASKKEKLDFKKPLLPSNQYSSLPLDVDRNTKLRGSSLLEVLSVAVVSDSGEGFDLWGKIEVRTLSGTSLIFDREKSSAETLLSNQNATFTARDTTFADTFFKIKVNLKDVEGQKISILGVVEWDSIDGSFVTFGFEEDTPISWCDRQLCSVIRGENGYAALYYIIFSSGLLANVTVTLSDKSSSTNPQVYGKIFIEYSNFKYDTLYEQEHYRNILFHKHPEHAQLLSNFEVPLSKSLLGVPQNHSLIMDLNLTVTHPQTQAVENFCSRLIFDTPNDATSRSEWTIQGSCQNSFLVSVKWSEVPDDE